MVRPTITALDDYKDFILRGRSSGTSIPRIKNRLEREHGLPISVRTLKRRLQEWGAPARRVVTEVVPGLEETLQELFYQLCPSDAQLVDLLTERGYTVSLHGVRTLRHSVNIFRRQDPEQIEQRLEELRQFFETSSTSTPARLRSYNSWVGPCYTESSLLNQATATSRSTTGGSAMWTP